MMKETPLFAQHSALSAFMVDFHGWSMPLHYGSQIDEHHAVRQSAGMFDVSHMHTVELIDPLAQDMLRQLLANDVVKLSPGESHYSLMLNDQAGVIDDLIVYCLAPHHYRLIFNSATKERVIAWLSQQKIPFQQIEGHAIIALQGPQAIALLTKSMPELSEKLETCQPFECFKHEDWLIARTGYTGEDGVEIMLPDQSAPGLWQKLLRIGVVACGLGARDTLRLEAGMSLSGSDMDETITPKQARLNWVVDLKDATRLFIGRTAHEQEAAGRLLVGLLLKGKGVMRSGQHIVLANTDKEQPEIVVGIVTSGGFSPTLGGSIAFARIDKTHKSSTLCVKIRNQNQPVTVCPLPFYRQGKCLVSFN